MRGGCLWRCRAILVGPAALRPDDAPSPTLGFAPRGATTPDASTPALLYFFHPHLVNWRLYMRALAGQVSLALCLGLLPPSGWGGRREGGGGGGGIRSLEVMPLQHDVDDLLQDQVVLDVKLLDVGLLPSQCSCFDGTRGRPGSDDESCELDPPSFSSCGLGSLSWADSTS